MNYHKEQVFSPYSKDQLFDLIMDIDKYPEFLPWCCSGRVVSDENNIIEAELTINFKAFTYSYISDITIDKSSAKYNIRVNQKTGPFKNLLTIWDLKDYENGTMIDFTIECELKNPFLDGVLKIFFELAYKKMIAAFTQRADQLYG
ncbi:MAG: type II toxin-antitoxin system RatA family toxin [Rickettsiales bacterium]|nr:type II toxin-antitoxin system RatA family toxin [Rickettsiales bacterium]